MQVFPNYAEVYERKEKSIGALIFPKELASRNYFQSSNMLILYRFLCNKVKRFSFLSFLLNFTVFF